MIKRCYVLNAINDTWIKNLKLFYNYIPLKKRNINMNRSCEITDIMLSFKLPKEVIKYILDIERQTLLKKSYEESINIRDLFFNEDNYHKFYKQMLFRDIKNIKGDFVKLKQHKINFKLLLENVYKETGFINELFKKLKY